MILTDTFIVENAELVTEQRGGKNTRILRGMVVFIQNLF